MRRPRGPLAGAVLLLALACCTAPAAARVGDDADPKPPLGPPADATTLSYIVLMGDKPPVVTSEVSDAFRLAYPRARAAALAARGVVAAPSAAAREGAAADVERYSAQLRSDHERVLGAVPSAAGGGATIGRHFTYAVNGFTAAGLTERDAKALRAQPGVVSVEPVRRLAPRTYSTPEYLGLSPAGGVWDVGFNGTGRAGSSVLIGVIDTGGWGPRRGRGAGCGGRGGRVARAGSEQRRLRHGERRRQDGTQPQGARAATLPARWRPWPNPAPPPLLNPPKPRPAPPSTGVTPAAGSFGPIPRSGTRWDNAGPGTGTCNEANTCTAGKLVGCEYFEAAFNNLLKKYYPNEVREPSDVSTCVDKDGHGSHTSSTAGGNFGVPAVLNGVTLAPGGMSGMAPGAAVAMYKVGRRGGDGGKARSGADGGNAPAGGAAQRQGRHAGSRAPPAPFPLQPPSTLNPPNPAPPPPPHPPQRSCGPPTTATPAPPRRTSPASTRTSSWRSRSP
jgi:hypothetical protein